MWERNPPLEPFELDRKFEPCYTFGMTELRQRILELREQGLSYRQIESEVGCARSTIAYHLGDGQKRKTYNRSLKSRGKRRNLVSELKTKEPCKDCGVDYPAHIMQFDHVRGEKLGNISEMVRTASDADLLEEIAKCDIVCANCHAQRTWERQIKGGEQAHGYTGLV